MQIKNYDAITFDVYGTLIDWEPAILSSLKDWVGVHHPHADGAELLDAFDRARAHYQALSPVRPYPEILHSAYAYIVNEYGLDLDSEEQNRFGQSVATWQPYSDSVAALARLRDHCVLGALTNVDNHSFAASHAKLGNCFDVVVSAERAGAYKPSLRHFVLGLTDLAARNISPQRVLHVAQSLRADVRPANLLGQDVVWINRGNRGLGHTGFGAELAVPMAMFPTMESFVSAIVG